MSMMIRRHKQKIAKKKVQAETKERTLSEASATDNRPLTYTKTDIMRMTKTNLVDLANQNGIKDAESMSGNAIKRELVRVLGL